MDSAWSFVWCFILFKLTFLVIFFKKLKTADWLTGRLNNYFQKF